MNASSIVTSSWKVIPIPNSFHATAIIAGVADHRYTILILYTQRFPPRRIDSSSSAFTALPRISE